MDWIIRAKLTYFLLLRWSQCLPSPRIPFLSTIWNFAYLVYSFFIQYIFFSKVLWIAINHHRCCLAQSPTWELSNVRNVELTRDRQSRYRYQCWGSERFDSDSDPCFQINSDSDSAPFGSGSESECVRIRIWVKINPENWVKLKKYIDFLF